MSRVYDRGNKHNNNLLVDICCSADLDLMSGPRTRRGCVVKSAEGEQYRRGSLLNMTRLLSDDESRMRLPTCEGDY